MNNHKKKICACLAATLVLLCSCLFKNLEEKRDLRVALAQEVQGSDAYTPETYGAYSTAHEKARKLRWNLFAKKDVLVDVCSDLEYAIFCLELKPDKTALQNAYQEAVNIDIALYTPNGIPGLQASISRAKTVLDDVNAVDSEVSRALNNLAQSVQSLTLIPDKSTLTTKRQEAQSINTALYLPFSTTKLNAALKNAQDILDNVNASQKEVNDCLAELDSAVTLLVLKPDKALLLECLQQAKAITEEKYTTETYERLRNALSSATVVANNENATQTEVSNAISSLNNATNQLQKTTKSIYRVNIYYSRVSNNHVGDSWRKYCTYNGKEVNGTVEITAIPGSSASFGFKIIENDSAPDVGRGSLSISLKDGNEKSTSIFVRENRGRYTGNQAKWVVTCNVTCVKRI